MELLQIATAQFITKYDGQLLQIATAFLLQSAMIITNCDSACALLLLCYKSSYDDSGSRFYQAVD